MQATSSRPAPYASTASWRVRLKLGPDSVRKAILGRAGAATGPGLALPLSASTAASTLLLVASRTPPRPFSTRSTVAVPTPEARAMSRIVGPRDRRSVRGSDGRVATSFMGGTIGCSAHRVNQRFLARPLFLPRADASLGAGDRQSALLIV